MYSTCLFCNRSLGANVAIEEFPVGERLAFDPAKGRLWVICRRCERWNLSPLEERWEAIESCERRFRDTRLRMSTPNIGLTRLREGLELVRIGSPQRPELAAWRYGDQFGRRRRQRFVRVGIGTVAVGGLAAGFVTAGIGTGAGLWLLARMGEGAYERIVHGSPRAVVANVPLASGERIAIQRRHLRRIELGTSHATGGWSLSIPQGGSKRGWHGAGYRRSDLPPSSRTVILSGDDALRAAGFILPAMNAEGANERQVAAATGLLEDAPSLTQLFARAGGHGARTNLNGRGDDSSAMLAKLDVPLRLALEMAAHEESERRALEGELVLLEAAWKEAEEIAAIADNLLLPSGIEDRVRRETRRE